MDNLPTLHKPGTSPSGIVKVAALMVIFYITGLVMIQAREIIVPFLTALTVWFLVSKVLHWVEDMPPLRRWVPSWLAMLLTMLLILAVISAVGGWIASSLSGLVPKLPQYQANLEDMISRGAAALNVTAPAGLDTLFAKIDLTAVGTGLANILANVMSNASMVLIYALFIFMDQANFGKKIAAMFPEESARESVVFSIDKISHRIENYLSIKTFTSVLTASISYLFMWFIGLDHAPVWALLIFLLNFIPTIGSIAGVVFPVGMALVQFGDWFQPLVMLVTVGLTQLITSNYMEPKMMGRTMNLSPTVIIVAMVVFGSMWGVMGMVLSVPMLVIAITVLGAFEPTRWLAILLSEDGTV
ncbi:MAG: AI-2E family transporter [Gammaproteobacteria bacterium]|nr:AI-2E family transporter [Gammaproteobacteria bacterium]